MDRSFLIPALLAIALAAGGTADASMPRSVAPTPSLPCSLPYGTDAALVSPPPVRLGAPVDTRIVIAASRDLPKAISVVALDGGGTVAARGALKRMPAPPAALPGSVYYRSADLTLRPGQRYTIALDNVAQNGCAPYAPLTGGADYVI